MERWYPDGDGDMTADELKSVLADIKKMADHGIKLDDPRQVLQVVKSIAVKAGLVQ